MYEVVSTRRIYELRLSRNIAKSVAKKIYRKTVQQNYRDYAVEQLLSAADIYWIHWLVSFIGSKKDGKMKKWLGLQFECKDGVEAFALQ
jgi:hypothetical protein